MIIEMHGLWLVENCHLSRYLRIFSCLACVYRIMDARGKFGEHEKMQLWRVQKMIMSLG